MTHHDKQHVRKVMEEVEDLDLPDGAHWKLIHEKLGLAYGDLFPIITADPGFFGLATPGDHSAKENAQ